MPLQATSATGYSPWLQMRAQLLVFYPGKQDGFAEVILRNINPSGRTSFRATRLRNPPSVFYNYLKGSKLSVMQGFSILDMRFVTRVVSLRSFDTEPSIVHAQLASASLVFKSWRFLHDIRVLRPHSCVSIARKRRCTETQVYHQEHGACGWQRGRAGVHYWQISSVVTPVKTLIGFEKVDSPKLFGFGGYVISSFDHNACAPTTVSITVLAAEFGLWP